jgi:hypothetical protein
VKLKNYLNADAEIKTAGKYVPLGFNCEQRKGQLETVW